MEPATGHGVPLARGKAEGKHGAGLLPSVGVGAGFLEEVGARVLVRPREVGGVW